MRLAISIAIDGIAYGMILFMISVGLSVTMGLMRIVNLAHGVFAMIGAFAVYWLMFRWGIRFELALLLGIAFTVLVAHPLNVLFFRRLYGKGDLEQVLLTIGLVFIAIATATVLFGTEMRSVQLPGYLQGSVDVGVRILPVHRIAVIVSGLAIAVLLWLAIERTRFGIHLRAAVDKESTASALGINTSAVYAKAFLLGAALAAFGGVMGAELMPVEANYPLRYLVLVLLVVAVGGMGSIAGTFFAALLLGIIDTAGRYFVPELGTILFYAVTMLILAFRPDGLFGSRGKS